MLTERERERDDVLPQTLDFHFTKNIYHQLHAMKLKFYTPQSKPQTGEVHLVNLKISTQVHIVKNQKSDCVHKATDRNGSRFNLT